ncbi:YitT family protein [uncultured Sanguibacteroides sp.]|uniref:YitT family protein n=1 Tax=uncultured Sanguibacteroides sp. TaxID=1635151 RepID=UPI0025E2F554|nr:YitT family protein [uncultured Sanguibacteroides sp.]
MLSKKKVLSEVRAYVLITIGLMMYAFAVTAFLAPQKIVGGGVTGIATIIYFLSNEVIPIGVSYFVINFLLVAIAMKILGPKFGIKTIYAIFMSSFLLGILQSYIREPLLEDRFMCAIISGIMCGAGIGISLVNGGSTAGTDIIAMIINKYRNISPGKIIMYIDVVIIGCSYFIEGSFQDIIYGYVVMGVVSYTIDMVFTGQMQSVQFLIFSDKYEEVANSITHDLKRGVTVLDCLGWYTGSARKMLVVVVRKNEMQNIMRVTKQVDPDAFLTMNTVMGVYGKGFDTLRP